MPVLNGFISDFPSAEWADSHMHGSRPSPIESGSQEYPWSIVRGEAKEVHRARKTSPLDQTSYKKGSGTDGAVPVGSRATLSLRL